MKHLTTLLTLFLSCTMLAQGPVEFPWNPDSDGDDFIGVNDLMALLGEFDSVFSEEALYLSEDELSAMYDAGTMNFLDCQIACKNLPGRWSMPEFEDVTVTGQEMWLKSEGYPNEHDRALYLNDTPETNVAYLSQQRGCFCVTKERPKVEYDYCLGYYNTSGSSASEPIGSMQAVKECVDEKLLAGWQLLGPVQCNAFSGSHTQTLWRWAE